ncbi:xylulokinase [Agrobacterium rubi]|uniref:Xylulose kinase n=1 Tax=Agrobacterium rubi TaxID=28099 RepID=A0AAE7USG3_9HYPH|nr:FGGY-family carbohydrate kinase [Agrobacterium rubi]NTE88406.1 xylulose kinase [Agrobacterium rubi]NTF04172.1 xylulose kinase [Agrobacterium rubi]NTF38503.1 xylulose kinase [Agrobacterium rubi]OCJ47164.1 xylulose kinase [Agrobacterium rubi]QTG02306.1 xylulose kinase [Agrobacterium rubi]
MLKVEQYILAIDLGTSGCKVGLVSITGQVVAWAFRSVQLTVVDSIGAEQRPDDWWNAFVGAAQEVLAQDLVPRSNIVAICSSTQGEGTVAVDRDGQPLMNAVLWLDMRGARHLKQEMRSSLKVAGYDPIKLQKWIRLCGGAPALSGKDPAGHMLLIRDSFPEIYARTYKFLNVLDYFNLRLTGRFVATQDSILTSWVTDNRDVDNIRYDDGLIAISGIDKSKFPELVRCTDVIGTILPSVSEALGLSVQTQVVAGAIDNTAAALGAGTLDDYDCHLYVGSSSWIAAHVPYKKTSVLDQIGSVPCAVPSRYLMIAMQSSGANNITFLKDRIVFHDDGLIDAEPSVDTYRVLDEIAARMPIGADGAMYLPWLFGERCPVDDQSLRAGLFNLSMEHNRETIVRAVFEGVALNTRWMMKPITRFMARRPKAITMIGGGAMSNAWCQIYADILDVTIRQPHDPMKANSRGAAFIGAHGLGLIGLDEAVRHVKIERCYEPNPSALQFYDERFGIFTELHRRLAPLYQKLNGSKGRNND